jgi:hypothetical protein
VLVRARGELLRANARRAGWKAIGTPVIDFLRMGGYMRMWLSVGLTVAVMLLNI